LKIIGEGNHTYALAKSAEAAQTKSGESPDKELKIPKAGPAKGDDRPADAMPKSGSGAMKDHKLEDEQCIATGQLVV